jgi:aspartyl-tRNA(Asn)/glutamyl-tRNA(Gln) amidotransferase subunit A
MNVRADEERRSAAEMADDVRAGRSSARQLVETSLERIRNDNPRINAFVYLDTDGALAAADAIDAQVQRGEDPGVLAGVPFGIKDLRDRCVGMPTRNGSLLTRDAKPDLSDSPQIERLKRAGAIPLGKVATAEFGLDGVTHTLLHGTTRNPWRLSRTPSGSSGGSSAAVAAGLVPLATGGDGLGSIRCPAGFTGMVGHKPSLGRIPRTDGFADTSCPGAITATVADTARYLDVVSGPDDRDRMTLPAAEGCYESAIENLDVRGLKAVWSADLGFAPVEPEVAAICEEAVHRLVEAAGLSLVATRYSCTNPYIAWNALAAVALRHDFEYRGYLPDRLDDISPGPRRFIERYAYQDPKRLVEYRQTVMRTEQEMAELFRSADVLLTPTACCVPYAAEGPLPEVIAGMDASETNGEPFTALASIGWNPSVSVPAGLSSDGLPIGLLINVRRHRDDIALRLARISEIANPWPLRACQKS